MSSEKEKKCKEYCNGTVYVPLIDTENVEAMLYNMRAMAFCAGWDALNSQLAKRDEDIARRAFEAGAKRKEINETVHWEEAQRRGFRFLAGDERETVEFFVRTQTATDYINSEEFKKR